MRGGGELGSNPQSASLRRLWLQSHRTRTRTRNRTRIPVLPLLEAHRPSNITVTSTISDVITARALVRRLSGGSPERMSVLNQVRRGEEEGGAGCPSVRSTGTEYQGRAAPPTTGAYNWDRTGSGLAFIIKGCHSLPVSQAPARVLLHAGSGISQESRRMLFLFFLIGCVFFFFF